eukprot:Tbor_TRINITY_DN5255_c6_g2::TRINITY_DN5255_c6_g2_i2::g.16623::m.16623/K02940/RP-L9e, RPL9; large subunit ribosomal protein L9e
MKIKSQKSLGIPEGCTCTIKDRVVTVTGPRGTLKKDLRHMNLDFKVSKNLKTVTAVRWYGAKQDISLLGTSLSHIRNMFTGVTKGFRFKIRFASAHFPINVTVEGQEVEIRNFIGEKRVRRQSICPGVKVYRTDPSVVKDELVMEGNDLEEVAREAALTHSMCLVKKKDIRKFLDGLYVMSKSNIVEE